MEFVEGLIQACDPKTNDLTGLRISVPLDLIDFEDPPGYKLEAFGRTLFLLGTQDANVVTNVIIQGWWEYSGLSQEEADIVLDTGMESAIDEYFPGLQTNSLNMNNI